MAISPGRWARVCVALWLAACSKEGGKQGDTDAAGADGFCVELLTALSDHVEQCGCGQKIVEQWRAGISRCDEESALDSRALLAAGELTYHPAAKDKLLAKLRDPKTPCKALFFDLGLDSVSAYTMGDVFVGTREVGESCSTPVGQKGGINGCKPGALCVRSEDDSGRCVALAKRGDACDLGSAPRRICFDRRPPDSDDEFESAFDFLVCVADGPGATTGTCRAELADAERCVTDESCKSGRCAWSDDDDDAGRCSPQLANGAACDFSSDCSSGACVNNKCGAPAADGVDCGYDDRSCASGVCYTPDDQTNGTDPGVCGPKLARAVGASCSQGYECASGVCRDDTCLNEICD